MKNIVTTTYLEILDRSELNAKVCSDPHFTIDECIVKQWPLNKFLYQYVGGQWKWKDRLSYTDQQWMDYAFNPNLRTWVAFHCGNIAGYYDLVKEGPNVEIQYFGLTPDFIGKGLGGPLLTHAIQSGFDWDAKRVWVHTCTLDHEYAIANYIARGMKVYKEETQEM